MLNNTDLVKRKQMRGDIVTMLYKDFGRPPMPVKTLIFALMSECPTRDRGARAAVLPGRPAKSVCGHYL
jgi:hypothetical protein